MADCRREGRKGEVSTSPSKTSMDTIIPVIVLLFIVFVILFFFSPFGKEVGSKIAGIFTSFGRLSDASYA
ncbi:MAG: hypothetical protein V1820_04565 [archaeon]